MSKYSVDQIDRVWHLVMDHNMNAYQVADIMDCHITDAAHLIEAAAEVHNRHLATGIIKKRKAKPETPVKEVVIRPAAEYSNTKW
jgi:hypothetical protein